jgi:hypothetical protein
MGGAIRGGPARCAARRPLWGRAETAILLACLALVACFPSGATAAAAELTRPDYVSQLETICKPDAEATQRAVAGTRADVRRERFRRAAAKVIEAKRIFTGTVRSISAVARPAADRAILARWYAALGRESTALARTAAALRVEDLARFQRVWADFIHEGNKANNVVVSFGFNYCAFKASRFI